MYVDVDSFAEAYTQIRTALLDAPHAAPRGLNTRELLGVTIHLRNPRSRLIYHPNRKYSLPLMCAEATCLFTPSNALAPLAYINPRMKQFSDDGHTLYGAYGARIHTSLRRIIKKLKSDEESRQAILMIARPEDLFATTKDFPCTMTIQFLLRENKLHMFVNMRSNDFWWGTQYDIPVFAVLQEVLANELECAVGTYQHSTASMHVYEHFVPSLEFIDQVIPVEFAIDYTIATMELLAMTVHNLSTMEPETVTSFTQGPFEEIFAQFLAYKKNRHYTSQLHQSIWAKPFLDTFLLEQTHQ